MEGLWEWCTGVDVGDESWGGGGTWLMLGVVLGVVTIGGSDDEVSDFA